MVKRSLTRRALVGAGVSAAGVAALAGGAGLVACGQATTAALRLDVLRSALADLRGGAALALPRMPRNEAAANLLAKPLVDAALHTTCPVTRRDLLRAQMRADFQAGKWVEHNDWIVSDTECLIATVFQDAIGTATGA